MLDYSNFMIHLLYISALVRFVKELLKYTSSKISPIKIKYW